MTFFHSTFNNLNFLSFILSRCDTQCPFFGILHFSNFFSHFLHFLQNATAKSCLPHLWHLTIVQQTLCGQMFFIFETLNQVSLTLSQLSVVALVACISWWNSACSSFTVWLLCWLCDRTGTRHGTQTPQDLPSALRVQSLLGSPVAIFGSVFLSTTCIFDTKTKAISGCPTSSKPKW